MAAVKTRTVTEKGFIPESAVIELWAAYYLKAVQERHAQLDLRLTRPRIGQTWVFASFTGTSKAKTRAGSCRWTRWWSYGERG